ncbi:hypothetical protein [Candidatus Laterigemmans baculatus]|uniref:hypothetical protein n=1 Tax=Candidatus Laterigemmans baculatus TaxID=2770505 RepID=UPI0013DA7748|nr:hypothetical protein [Candidatus Laterigemmans baculatus]
MESDLEYEVPFETSDDSTPEAVTPAAVTPEAVSEDVVSEDAASLPAGSQHEVLQDEVLQDEVLQDGASLEDGSLEDAAEASSEPFIGQWNRLISSTNWEKGRIISEWRARLEADGAAAAEYSDEAWARRVGGVTAPHVGRLRRVYQRFADQYETYPGLYWSHFLAALDWDDAPLWLEGAVRSGWSISQMRQQRWEANGARPEDQPQAAEIVSSDTDEDVVVPAQGGGNEGRNEGRFENEPDGISAGPVREEPDFGDADDAPFAAGDDPAAAAEGEQDNLDGPGSPSLVQPFAGLPDLPADMSEALEMFKLSIIRHKADGWRDVAPEAVIRTLEGLTILVSSRSE